MAYDKPLEFGIKNLGVFLFQSGFINSVADPSLLIFRHESVVAYMLVYVDDLIFTEIMMHFYLRSSSSWLLYSPLKILDHFITF